VEADGSGSINLTGLTFFVNVASGAPNGGVNSAFGALLVGVGNTIDTYKGSTGPTSLGPGGLTLASFGSGPIAGVSRFNPLMSVDVPTGYVSGTVLNDSSTWNNTTINGPGGLGLTPGTYTWTWNTTPAVVGPNTPGTTDYVQVNIVSSVPAPPSVIPLAIGALGLLGYGWRRRKQAQA
jgi:hypothetical protein